MTPELITAVVTLIGLVNTALAVWLRGRKIDEEAGNVVRRQAALPDRNEIRKRNAMLARKKLPLWARTTGAKWDKTIEAKLVEHKRSSVAEPPTFPSDVGK